MARDFKKKYHGDKYKSEFYAELERIALHKLRAIVNAARLPLRVVPIGVGTTKSGIVRGHSSTLNRPDFAIYRPGDKAVVCLVEFTSDPENDNVARILAEKIEIVEEIVLGKKIPVFFMYAKRYRSVGDIKKVKFFDARTVITAYRFGCDDPQCKIDLYLPDEGPYLYIPLKLAMTVKQFVSRLEMLPHGIGNSIPKITIEELRR